MNHKALQALASDFAARLKADAPDWTDHEEHDPGVTLLEVFAFLSRSDRTTFPSAGIVRSPE